MKELHLKSVYDPVAITWVTLPGNHVETDLGRPDNKLEAQGVAHSNTLLHAHARSPQHALNRLLPCSSTSTSLIVDLLVYPQNRARSCLLNRALNETLTRKLYLYQIACYFCFRMQFTNGSWNV